MKKSGLNTHTGSVGALLTLLGQLFSESNSNSFGSTENAASLGKEGVMNPNDIDREAIQMRCVVLAELVIYLWHLL